MKQLQWDAFVEPGDRQDGTGGTTTAGKVVLCSGAIAAERALLARVRDLQPHGSDDAGLLARPVLVVVPSSELRLHLVRRLARDRGGACMGVAVLTLRAFAERVLERASCEIFVDGSWFELLARQEAAREPELIQSLGAFEDGFAVAASAMRDLLSAGSSTADEAALQEVCEQLPPHWRKRANAIVRASTRTRARLDQHGLLRSGDLFERAAEAIAHQGAAATGAHAVLVHGFADATGQAVRLLEELLRAGATVLVDRPPTPAGAGQSSESFSDRLVNALKLVATVEQLYDTDGARRTNISAFDAAGADAECNEVAHRVQELHASGVSYDEVAVVARNLERYELALRRALHDRGVPFSGGPVRRPLAASQRRFQAVQQLLAAGTTSTIDLWLAARVWSGAPSDARRSREREDLRLILRSLGVATVEDLAQIAPYATATAQRLLRVPRFRSLTLMGGAVEPSWEEMQPVAETALDGADDDTEAAPGLAPGEDEDDHGEQEEHDEQPAVRAARGVPLSLLQEAQKQARWLCEQLAAWPTSAPVRTHVDHTIDLLQRCLGWPADPPDDRWVPAAWVEALGWLSEAAPVDVCVDRQEYLLLLARRPVAQQPLGGAGAGVQVLDVAHARGLTFEHLFVLGLNRSVFPRSIVEDPWLPDDVRGAFQAILPDLQRKSRGHLEERHLFDELLSAAPQVTLSWLREDAEGRALSPSALLQRALPAHDPGDLRHLPADRVTRLQPPWAGTPDRPRSAMELMQLAGVVGDRAGHAATIAPQAREASRWLGSTQGQGAPSGLDVATLSSARVPLLEPNRGRGADLVADWQRALAGFVGPAGHRRDRRARPLYVTTLEEYAACPWRALLRRLLRLEPLADPQGRLPTLDARLVGNVVHHALERLVERQHLDREAQTEAGDHGSATAALRRLSKPADAVVQTTTRSVARDLALQEGLALPGLQRALAQRALPLVQRAVALDWPHAAARLAVVGVEQTHSLAIEGTDAGTSEVWFKADRVDQQGHVVVLTDYKTGRIPSRARRDATRQRALERGIRAGTRLQVAVYAASASEGTQTLGRYLYLDPELPIELTEIRVSSQDEVVARELRPLLGLLSRGWQEGIFFPRLEDHRGREPSRCSRCDVAEACVRGDSGARAELRELMSALRERREAGQQLLDTQQLVLRLWDLGQDAAGRAAPGG